MFALDAPDEQGRNQALLNATIGVAHVRERVFAEIRGDRALEHSLTPGAGETGSDLPASVPHRRPDHGFGLRHGTEPLPRFRETIRPRTSTEPNEPSRATRPRAEPEWAPRTRGQGRPTPRTTSRPGTPAAELPLRVISSPLAKPATTSASTEGTWPVAGVGASVALPALKTDPALVIPVLRAGASTATFAGGAGRARGSVCLPARRSNCSPAA